uniref:Uncharacterized protein n=1 Tax=Trichogramma kaykai TaxID=54128 RepID=A0ABD2WPQ0_9HYME
MESSGTFSYATKVKEESIDMSYIESYNGETKCHTSDTENVQYLSFLQENTGKFKGTSGAVGNVGLVDLRKYAARFGLKDRSFPSERDWMARLR